MAFILRNVISQLIKIPEVKKGEVWVSTGPGPKVKSF